MEPPRSASVPDLEETVPGPCGDGHAVLRDAEAAHSVVVARQYTCVGRNTSMYSVIQTEAIPVTPTDTDKTDSFSKNC